MADDGDQRETPRSATAGTEREATEIEREGMDLLGRSSVRDGALDGVGDASARADLSADPAPRSASRGGRGKRGGCDDPDVGAHSGTGDGGLSAGGGVAGGARGNTGRSATGGDPERVAKPSQAESTSRGDLDHPSRREEDGPGRGHESGW